MLRSVATSFHHPPFVHPRTREIGAPLTTPEHDTLERLLDQVRRFHNWLSHLLLLVYRTSRKNTLARRTRNGLACLTQYKMTLEVPVYSFVLNTPILAVPSLSFDDLDEVRK